MYVVLIFVIDEDVHGRNTTLEGVPLCTSTHIYITHCYFD